MCYKDNDDVVNDNEIQSWIREINTVGFPTLPENRRGGLPQELGSISELADLVTKVSTQLNNSYNIYPG